MNQTELPLNETINKLVDEVANESNFDGNLDFCLRGYSAMMRDELKDLRKDLSSARIAMDEYSNTMLSKNYYAVQANTLLIKRHALLMIRSAVQLAALASRVDQIMEEHKTKEPEVKEC